MITNFLYNDNLQIGHTENRRPVLMQATIPTSSKKQCIVCDKLKTDFHNNTRICIDCYTKLLTKKDFHLTLSLDTINKIINYFMFGPHYLRNKEPKTWDKYDISNFKALLRNK